MSAITKLLHEVNWFNKNKKLEVDKNDDQFNMFKICGVNHYENTHSSIIAELLNPNGSHRFKHLFLDAFIQVLISSEILEPQYEFSYDGVNVSTEYATSFGRLDILVTNSLGEAILLENKIYAGDQFEQLKRYYAFGEHRFGQKFKLLYLTLWGNESPEAKSNQVDYCQVSYQDIILQWLDRCIEIAVRSPIVRETLIQYSNHLKDLTNKNTTAMMDQELINKLSSDEHLESVFTIAENVNHVKNNLINKVFLPQLSEIAEELDIKSTSQEMDYVNTGWAGFSFSIDAWKNYNIFMEFGAKGLRNLVIGLCPKNEQVDTSAFPAIKNKVGGGNNRCAFTRFSQYPTWEGAAMKAIVNGEMKSAVKKEIIKLLDATRGIENI